jgi:hypothetical protein
MRILLLPLAAATLLTLSACSVAGGTGGAPVANSAAAGGTSAAASAPAAASKTGAVDVCNIIPLATIVSATGRSVYTTATSVTAADEGATLYVCEYTDGATIPDSLNVFNIGVYRGGDPTKIMADLATSQGSGAVPHSGIGDRAQLGDTELDVVVGTDVLEVSDTARMSQFTVVGAATLEKLARQLMAKL